MNTQMKHAFQMRRVIAFILIAFALRVLLALFLPWNASMFLGFILLGACFTGLCVIEAGADGVKRDLRAITFFIFVVTLTLGLFFNPFLISLLKAAAIAIGVYFGSGLPWNDLLDEHKSPSATLQTWVFAQFKR